MTRDVGGRGGVEDAGLQILSKRPYRQIIWRHSGEVKYLRRRQVLCDI
jgi:hypothetical protein